MICAQIPGHRCLNICGDLDNLEAAENAEVGFQMYSRGVALLVNENEADTIAATKNSP